VSFTKKWSVVFCVMAILFCSAVSSFAAEEKYILEKETVYRVNAEGKRQKIEDVNVVPFEFEKGVKSGAWFAVDSEMNDAMEGSENGIYFFDDKDEPLFFLPFGDASYVSGIIFSPDGRQILLDTGTWVVRHYILYDFKKTKEKASFSGMDNPIWIDPSRFAFTMVEPDAEPRPSATDFDGWTSVVVYDTAAKKIVKTKADWANPEKFLNKELTAPFPAAKE